MDKCELFSWKGALKDELFGSVQLAGLEMFVEMYRRGMVVIWISYIAANLSQCRENNILIVKYMDTALLPPKRPLYIPYIFPSFPDVRTCWIYNLCGSIKIITYILVSTSTPLAVTDPYGQLASPLILQQRKGIKK